MQLLKHVSTNYKTPLPTKEAAAVPPAPAAQEEQQRLTALSNSLQLPFQKKNLLELSIHSDISRRPQRPGQRSFSHSGHPWG